MDLECLSFLSSLYWIYSLTIFREQPKRYQYVKPSDALFCIWRYCFAIRLTSYVVISSQKQTRLYLYSSVNFFNLRLTFWKVEGAYACSGCLAQEHVRNLVEQSVTVMTVLKCERGHKEYGKMMIWIVYIKYCLTGIHFDLV